MPVTWIDPEERAYPNGGFTRKGRAILRRNGHNPIDLPYGEIRAIRLSIPDTYFSIPARLRYHGKTIKGFVMAGEGSGTHPAMDLVGEYYFVPDADPVNCRVCGPNDGCKYNP